MKRLFAHRWLFFGFITAIGFFLDWLTKFWASTKLAWGEPVKVAGKYVQFFLIYNQAALWGIDPRRVIPGFPLNQFFFVFSIVAVVILVVYYKSVKPTDRLLSWGLALIMPGALGNLFDRVLHPQRGVVDFIKVGLSDTLYWPIFNFADIYVTVGVGLILLGLLLEEIKKKSLSNLQALPEKENT
ncbi:MAG: signal peptidase II [Chitinivibrionales bacterium]|nr:signal peptidase II [Chitinivibrionales bacterium]